MPIYAYLAGPDVFLPNAAAHGAAKAAICARYGIIGRPPLNEDITHILTLPHDAAWRLIYQNDLEMMSACDIIIANLTPFRGPSADAGTLLELGWFAGRNRPVFAYSNMAQDFATRSATQIAAFPDPIHGIAVEGFSLPDNLMIPGAVEYGGGLPIITPPDNQDRAFDALEIFERCVAAAARTGWGLKQSSSSFCEQKKAPIPR